jgi:hypothetical protein
MQSVRRSDQCRFSVFQRTNLYIANTKVSYSLIYNYCLLKYIALSTDIFRSLI